MFCTKCGNPVADTARFCSACGNPLTPAPQPPVRQAPVQQAPVQQPRTDGIRRLYFSVDGVSFVNYKFAVRDAAGNQLYSAATETVSMVRYAAKLYDMAKRELFMVEQQSKMTMMAMNFDMKVNGQVVSEILQIVKMTKYAFELPQLGISIDGDFIGHTYRFLRGGQCIGEVKRSMMSWGDAYEISFADPNLEQPLLAAVLAIELVTIAQRNNRRRRR